jgi:hypothetical protein
MVWLKTVTAPALTPQNHEKCMKKSKNFWKNFHGNRFVNGAMRFFSRGLFSLLWAMYGCETIPSCPNRSTSTPEKRHVENA